MLKKHIWVSMIAVLSISITLMATNRYLLDGIIGSLLPLVIGDTTEYAQGYSDDRFRRVRVQMGADEVLSLLGSPLKKVSLTPTSEAWAYSWSPSDGSYRVRSVVMENGRVSESRAGFYVD